MISKHVLHIIATISCFHQYHTRFITTPYGVLHGSRITHLEKQVDIFHGIPYAKPPIGPLRFKHPQPADPWRPLVLDVHRPHMSCFQPKNVQTPEEEYRRISGDFSEDCLYLDIWAPVVHHNVSVMVWIHGGNFYEGSPHSPLYTGQFLAGESDVIIVSVTYRLGPLGFGYLGPDTIPGNMGLLDQAMALSWIKNNIEYFGGDPTKITIFGQDAGAIAVGMHILSPSSRDLFDRAILQSGIPTIKRSYNDRTKARQQMQRLGILMGCPINSNELLTECLRAVDAQRLVDGQMLIMADGPLFLPVIDGKFLPGDPRDIVESGNFKKTSILQGIVNDEADILLHRKLDTSSPSFSLSNEQFEIHLQNYLSFVNDKFRSSAVSIYYKADQGPESQVNYLKALSSVMTDLDFACPTIDFAAYFSRTNPSYLYNFRHRSSKTPHPVWIGASHTDELEYVFGLPINVSLGFTQDEQHLSWSMMTYWTNFAKSGDPNIPVPVPQPWPPYDVINKHYMVLDVGNGLDSKQGLRHRQCVFLHQLLPMISTEVVTTASTTQTQVTTTIRCPEILNLPIDDPPVEPLNTVTEAERQQSLTEESENQGSKLTMTIRSITTLLLVVLVT